MAFLGMIKIHAGDFASAQLIHGQLVMRSKGRWKNEKINLLQIDSLEVATEESVVNVSGAAGWGLAGHVLFGPVGTLAGLMLGGKGNDITFICRLKDGRKFLGTTSASVFQMLNVHLLSRTGEFLNEGVQITTKPKKSKWRFLWWTLGVLLGIQLLAKAMH